MGQRMSNIWQEIISTADKSGRIVKVLRGNSETGQKVCNKLGISADSALGSVVLNSGGIVIDNWIRLFGQGSIDNKNDKFKDFTAEMLLVAEDVVGGLFAMNLSRDEDNNLIWYFAPDTLEWECLDMKYGQFLSWAFEGNIDDFYTTMRWSTWAEDVKDIDINSGILIYPFLWAKECNIETAKKSVVPTDEIIGINLDYSRKL